MRRPRTFVGLGSEQGGERDGSAIGLFLPPLLVTAADCSLIDDTYIHTLQSYWVLFFWFLSWSSERVARDELLLLTYFYFVCFLPLFACVMNQTRDLCIFVCLFVRSDMM